MSAGQQWCGHCGSPTPLTEEDALDLIEDLLSGESVVDAFRVHQARVEMALLNSIDRVCACPRDARSLHVRELVARIPRATSGLYRIYSEDDTLLYVGMSRDVRNRVKDHLRMQAWNDEIDSVTYEYHRAFSRDERLALGERERAAIVTERPRYNVQWATA